MLFRSVIDVNDFWKNYNRLNERVNNYLERLDKKIQDEFHRKFAEELEKVELGTAKLIDRIAFIIRHTENKDDAKILKEIQELFIRFDRGVQMKVPLDKTLKKWSAENFYFCPLNWCYFCKLARTSDELTDKKTCTVCNNNVFNSTEGHSYISFPNSKQEAHLNCLPCCFKKEKKRRETQCVFSHPTHEIIVNPKNIRAQADYIRHGRYIPPGQHGYLDEEPTGKLNDFFNKGIVYKKPNINEDMIVRFGVHQPPSIANENSFLETMTHFHPDTIAKPKIGRAHV